MSEMNPNMNLNPNPNPAANGQGNGTNASKQQPAKENIFVSGFRRVKSAVSDGIAAVKAHPVTHGICAALGVTAGGYVAYKVATSMQPVPEPLPVPQIQEPVQKEEDQTTNPEVEYVDIPQTSTATESE